MTRRALLVALAAVVAAGGLFALTTQVLSQSSGTSLAAAELVVGKASKLVASVDEAPLLLPDASGRQLDLYVSHTGDDPATGWHAFAARRAGQPRSCTLEWRKTRFVDPCDGRRYPIDGEGLRQFRTRVVEGRVVVRLRSDTTTTR